MNIEYQKKKYENIKKNASGNYSKKIRYATLIDFALTYIQLHEHSDDPLFIKYCCDQRLSKFSNTFDPYLNKFNYDLCSKAIDAIFAPRKLIIKSEPPFINWEGLFELIAFHVR